MTTGVYKKKACPYAVRWLLCVYMDQTICFKINIK